MHYISNMLILARDPLSRGSTPNELYFVSFKVPEHWQEMVCSIVGLSDAYVGCTVDIYVVVNVWGCRGWCGIVVPRENSVDLSASEYG